MTKITYTQNRLTGQFIIQLIIDREDLLLPKFVPIEPRGMSVSEHLIYLAQLTAAIDAALTEEDNMIDTISEPDNDEVEPDEDTPAWDEDNREDEDDFDDDEDPSDEDDPGDEEEEEEEEEEIIDDEIDADEEEDELP